MWVQSPDPRPAVWHVPEVSSMFKLSGCSAHISVLSEGDLSEEQRNLGK